MDNYLEIHNLKLNHHSFEGTRPVLDIDHLAVERGKTLGIVGESGSGKTVLALTIQGLLQMPPGQIESGEIILDGQDILKLKPREVEKIRGQKVSMIFQDPMSALNPVYTVGDQMTRVVMERQGKKKKKAWQIAQDMVNTVKLPDAEQLMNKYPHELSGGQRQRIIIGLALLCGAELIIADEPTRNLDVTIQAGVLQLIHELQQKFQVAVLFIANNLALVSAMCDDVAILKEGKIVERGSAREIMDNPSDEYTKILINSVTPKRKQNDRRQISDERLLDVTGLKKYFPVKNQFMTKKNVFVKAVDDVDFHMNKGEIMGIVGESGCGKSTLVNTILLIHRPTEGKVLFDGKDIFSLNPQELRKARKDVQIVFQDPYWSLNPRWLVKDIIGEPLLVHEKLSSDEYTHRVQNLMEIVGLKREDIYMYPHEFSGGERQRLAIARALSVRPKLVVLDEPTSAIDVVSQSQMLALLDNLKEQMQLSYILISHDLGVVNYMADKIMIMYLGKVVEFGDSKTIFNDPKHPYTKALFNSIPDLRTKSVDDLFTIKGEVPSAINPPAGCRFHPRCEHCMGICKQVSPETKLVEGRYVGCHLYDE